MFSRLFVYVYVCVPPWIHVYHICTWYTMTPKEVCQIPWKWSHKRWLAATLLLGTESCSSAREAQVLICWAISPTPELVFVFKDWQDRTGEMAQQSRRAPVALAEVLGLIPNNHMETPNDPELQSQQGSQHPLLTSSTRYTCGAQPYMQARNSYAKIN